MCHAFGALKCDWENAIVNFCAPMRQEQSSSTVFSFPGYEAFVFEPFEASTDDRFVQSNYFGDVDRLATRVVRQGRKNREVWRGDTKILLVNP